MNRRVTGLLLALGVGAIIANELGKADPDARVPDAPVEVPLTTETPLAPEMLVKRRDGGKGYAVQARASDGGLVTRMTAPRCVRRPVATPPALCMRNDPIEGLRDFGALNRFPASEAAGAGCEPVACTIMFGEDADATEDARILQVDAEPVPIDITPL